MASQRQSRSEPPPRRWSRSSPPARLATRPIRSSSQLTTPKTWKFAEAGAGQPQIGDAMRPASVTQQGAHARKLTPSRALPFATSREAGARARRSARTRREGCAGRRDRAGWRSQRRGYVSSSQPGGPPSRSARPPLGHGVAQARPRRGRAPGMDEKDSCRAIPGAPPPSLLPFVRSGSHRQPEPGTAFIAEELRGR